MASNPTVFFDITAGGSPVGRIEMVGDPAFYLYAGVVWRDSDSKWLLFN